MHTKEFLIGSHLWKRVMSLPCKQCPSISQEESGFLPLEGHSSHRVICHMINPLLTRLIWSQWLDVVLNLFPLAWLCSSMGILSTMHKKKRSWLISTHLHLNMQISVGFINIKLSLFTCTNNTASLYKSQPCLSLKYPHFLFV